ncbi:tigger transposable element-derived protein 6-like [Sycon ciliatum]|uniref:tigger transposable element-derived protein 6-like n=1 Tax=Sycon ciliatum TaxID=27933 RepID=UPI0031F6A423
MSKQRVSTSLKEKIKIIDDHERRKLSVRDIPRATGKPTSTIYTILKNKDSCRKSWEPGQRSGKVKRIAHSKWPQLDKALFQWVVKARTTGVNVFDDTIQTKARELAEHFGISDEEFSASSGFCDKFKKRHQLSLRTMAGEGEQAARSNDIHDWQDEVLSGLLEGYAPKDVYNADEPALFY